MDAMLRSDAANTVFTAAAENVADDSDEQAVSNAVDVRSSLKAGVNALEVSEKRKADLYEYDKSLMLMNYEAVSSEPDETPTTTIAVTTDINGNFDNSDSESVVTSAITTIEEPAVTARETVIADPDSVVFYTYGFGHGVGMSQNGANFYAMYDGWTYDQILSLYYPGTLLVQTSVSEYDQMTVGGKTDTIVSILSQIVNNEMGDSFSVEAIKAQAVAAYTYYLYNGYGAGMICKANPSQKIVDAVRSVLGVVVYYENAPALTSFYASSGGATAACRDIFFQDLPYLPSIEVRHDESSDPHYNNSKVFSASELKNILETTYRITLTGTPYEWIQLEYGDGGYVAYAVIGGQVRVKGNDLRGVLGLKSPKFVFDYQPADAAASSEDTAESENAETVDSDTTKTEATLEKDESM
jgi:SpoIID/LytB domain protein